MDEIPVVANAYYLLDKGYVKFDSLYKHFHQNHAWFVTRAKDNMLYIVTDVRFPFLYPSQLLGQI